MRLNKLFAVGLVVMSLIACQTPQPAPHPSPTVAATATPRPTQTPTVAPTSTPTIAPTSTPVPTPQSSPTPTPTTAPSPTVVPTSPASPSPTPTATPSVSPSPTPTPIPTDTPTPQPGILHLSQMPQDPGGFAIVQETGHTGFGNAIVLTLNALPTTGNILIATIAYQGGNTNDPILEPPGWTEDLGSDNGSDIGMEVFHKVVTGTDGLTYAWILASGARISGIIREVSGINATIPFSASGIQNNTTATTISTPALVPNIIGTYPIADFAFDPTTTSATAAAQTGWSENYFANNNYASLEGQSQNSVTVNTSTPITGQAVVFPSSVSVSSLLLLNPNTIPDGTACSVPGSFIVQLGHTFGGICIPPKMMTEVQWKGTSIQWVVGPGATTETHTVGLVDENQYVTIGVDISPDTNGPGNPDCHNINDGTGCLSMFYVDPAEAHTNGCSDNSGGAGCATDPGPPPLFGQPSDCNPPPTSGTNHPGWEILSYIQSNSAKEVMVQHIPDGHAKSVLNRAYTTFAGPGAGPCPPGATNTHYDNVADIFPVYSNADIISAYKSIVNGTSFFSGFLPAATPSAINNYWGIGLDRQDPEEASQINCGGRPKTPCNTNPPGGPNNYKYSQEYPAPTQDATQWADKKIFYANAMTHVNGTRFFLQLNSLQDNKTKSQPVNFNANMLNDDKPYNLLQNDELCTKGWVPTESPDFGSLQYCINNLSDVMGQGTGGVGMGVLMDYQDNNTNMSQRLLTHLAATMMVWDPTHLVSVEYFSSVHFTNFPVSPVNLFFFVGKSKTLHPFVVGSSPDDGTGCGVTGSVYSTHGYADMTMAGVPNPCYPAPPAPHATDPPYVDHNKAPDGPISVEFDQAFWNGQPVDATGGAPYTLNYMAAIINPTMASFVVPCSGLPNHTYHNSITPHYTTSQADDILEVRRQEGGTLTFASTFDTTAFTCNSTVIGAESTLVLKN